MTSRPSIKLLISDVDGTLLTPDKRLAAGTISAVERLRAAGIRFTIISGRSADGLPPLISALGISEPVGAFNGAQIVWPNLSTLEYHTLPPPAARQAMGLLRQAGVDVWLHDFSHWYVSDLAGAFVARESATVGHGPHGVWSGAAPPADLIKITGVSDEPAKLIACEAALQSALGGELSASRSQPHYLDITQFGADKGHGLRRLAAIMGIELRQTAAIGDGFNDMPMLSAAGVPLAMGNGAAELRKIARHVAASNGEDGFAGAVDWLLAGTAG